MGKAGEVPESTVRVLQISDKFAMRGAPIHGAARLLLTWLSSFEGGVCHQTVCVLRGSEGGVGEFTKRGFKVIDLERGKFDLRAIVDLVRIIRRENIDVAHCHGYGSAVMGRVAARLCGIPAIVHEHMVDDDIPLYQRLSDLVLAPFTTKGIAVSKAVADFMVQKRGFRRSKVEVVPNSIPADSSCMPCEVTKKALADEINLPDGSPVIGIVGRLDFIKGHSHFLDMAAIVLGRVPQARFVILGDGILRDDLLAKTQELGIENRILFLGHRDDVRDIVSLFDVLTSCSLSEGFSLAVMEAMALGRAIVATRVGGVPELIEDGVSGLLVAPKDAKSMAERVLEVLTDPDLGRKIGANAFKRYEQISSGSSTRLQDIYSSVVASGR